MSHADEIAIIADIAARPRTRAKLEQEFGHVWNADEFDREFQITAIIPPTYVVRRRSDRVIGTVLCQPRPKLYFRFRNAPEPE